MSVYMYVYMYDVWKSEDSGVSFFPWWHGQVVFLSVYFLAFFVFVYLIKVESLGTSISKVPHQQASLWGIFLINDGYWRVQLAVGGMGLRFKRKQAEQAVGNESVSSTHYGFCFSFCPEFLSLLPSAKQYDLRVTSRNKLFPL